jgi:tetratricopeptide (TPR) repeat protein
VSLIALDRIPDAEELYQRAISLLEGILAKSPTDFAAKQELALSSDDFGELHWVRKRPADAERLSRAAYEMRTQLWKLAPGDPTTRFFLARSGRNLGKIYFETGRPELAATTLDQAIQLLEGLRNEHVDIPSYALELAFCYRRRSMIADEGTYSAKASHEYRRLLKANPEYPPANNNLAWHLATTKNPTALEAKEAVACAKKAVSLMPEASAYWNTLGLAYLRASEWKEAEAAIEKSIELGLQKDVSNWFFLALAKHKLGESTEARRWLAEATKLLEASAAPSVELKRLSDEIIAAFSSTPPSSTPPEPSR